MLRSNDSDPSVLKNIFKQNPQFVLSILENFPADQQLTGDDFNHFGLENIWQLFNEDGFVITNDKVKNIIFLSKQFVLQLFKSPATEKFSPDLIFKNTPDLLVCLFQNELVNFADEDVKRLLDLKTSVACSSVAEKDNGTLMIRFLQSKFCTTDHIIQLAPYIDSRADVISKIPELFTRLVKINDVKIQNIVAKMLVNFFAANNKVKNEYISIFTKNPVLVLSMLREKDNRLPLNKKLIEIFIVNHKLLPEVEKLTDADFDKFADLHFDDMFFSGIKIAEHAIDFILSYPLQALVLLKGSTPDRKKRVLNENPLWQTAVLNDLLKEAHITAENIVYLEELEIIESFFKPDTGKIKIEYIKTFNNPVLIRYLLQKQYLLKSERSAQWH